MDTYLVNITLPNGVRFPGVRVSEGKIAGADILIGMDIISSGDFALTNRDGKTTFTFRYPSIADIDFVQEASIEQSNSKQSLPSQETRARNRKKRK